MNGGRETIERLAVPLRRGADFLEIAAIVGAALGVLGGIALTFASQTNDTTTGHPYVAAGLTVIGGALILGMFNWCVARALKLFATDVALRYGVEVDQVQEPIAPGLEAALPVGWNSDPSKRHEARWWDGSRWTERVRDSGRLGSWRESADPLRAHEAE